MGQKIISLVARLAALAALTVTSVPATAQEISGRSVTLVVPFAAGGPMDAIGRILAPRMGELLGQPLILENVGGAGGMTGSARVAKAPPDGSQLVLGNFGTHAANQTFYKHPLYDAATDFAPVALIAEVPFVLVARKDLPADDLRTFIAYAKAHQAMMQYGSGGSGSATHIACLLLNAVIGIDVTHVPYRGGGLAMQDLIAGRIDYQCLDAPIAVPQVAAGTVKAIAVLSHDRLPGLPAVASAQEQGLTDFAADNWSAFFLPKGTPSAIVERFHDAALATMETPSVRERLTGFGAILVAPERRSSDYLAKFVAGEIEKWAAPIRASGASFE
jgi:tripartite-type tricarboxylate transporter receptor subunit TctC